MVLDDDVLAVKRKLCLRDYVSMVQLKGYR
jgi:hypothetical protein